MSTGLENIEIYYNTFYASKTPYNGKNPTDYVDMYDMPEFKNSLFIYTANEKNSGPGNESYGGSGTASVATKERAFGIITGYAGSTGKDGEQYAINNKYNVTYKFDNKAGKYIKVQPNTTHKTVKEHIDDQVTMLGNFITGWNNDDDNKDKITNIILPLIYNTDGELKLGVDIFKNYVTIAVVGEYWLNSVLTLFKKSISNLISTLNLLNRNSLAGTPSAATYQFNPDAEVFIPNVGVSAAIPPEATRETPMWRNMAASEAASEAATEASKKAAAEKAVADLREGVVHQPSRKSATAASEAATEASKANKSKKAKKTKKAAKNNDDLNNNADYNKYKTIYTENYNKYLTNKQKRLKAYNNIDLITYLNNLYNAINAYNCINNYLLNKYKTENAINAINAKDTKFYTIYNKINLLNKTIGNILDYIIDIKLIIDDDIKKINYIITDNHSNNNDMLLYSSVYIKHINNVQNLNLITILKQTLSTLYAKDQVNNETSIKNIAIFTQLNVNGYHICRYLLSLNKYSNIYNNDMLYININDMNNYIKTHLNNILNDKIKPKASKIIQELSEKAKKSAEDAKKAKAEADAEATEAEAETTAEVEANPEAEAQPPAAEAQPPAAEAAAANPEAEAQPPAAEAQPEVKVSASAIQILKQLIKDGTDFSKVETLFNELITLLNKNDTNRTNILELKNKGDNNILFQLKKPIIIVKPFSNTKHKEKCTFKTLFDILTDNRNNDNICTSVNLTSLQNSVYHFGQLINNFHTYIDNKYIKIEDGNIVITDANAILQFFDKKSPSSNANLKNIYTVLSKNINFSLNITMVNEVLRIKYVPLQTFFNTVINTKYFTLLKADNKIYELYNDVLKKHDNEPDNIRHFKYLYRIVHLINKNDNIKNSIINKYNSPSKSEAPRSAKPEESRRSEAPKSASREPEAPRSARREHVPLNNDTIKKLKTKISFVNI